MNNSIKKIFDKDGVIAKAMPGYEVRHEQIEMAEAVESAISHSEQLIVEAGTGIGKSFAYLVPLAEYALGNETLGIISTNTISLQEQIIHKDIPFLEKALDKDFKAVLVKGRNNYLCLRRLHRSEFLQKDLFSDQYELAEFTKLFAWSYKTQDGTGEYEQSYGIWRAGAVWQIFGGDSVLRQGDKLFNLEFDYGMTIWGKNTTAYQEFTMKVQTQF